MNFRKAIFTVMLVGPMAACGGGGSSSTPAADPVVVVVPPTPAGPVQSAGIFNVEYGQFSGTYVFLDNGDFYGLHFVSGTTLAGHPHGPLGASNTTGNLEHISWANFIDDDAKLGAQEANGKFGRTFTAAGPNVKISGSMGTFAATANDQLTYGDGTSKTLYANPFSLETLAGSYAGMLRTVGIATPQQAISNLIIDGTGHFTVTAANCDFAGAMVQHGTTGVYDLTATTSGAACKFLGALKGIVAPLSYASSLPKIALELDSTDNTQTAVFIVTKH